MRFFTQLQKNLAKMVSNGKTIINKPRRAGTTTLLARGEFPIMQNMQAATRRKPAHKEATTHLVHKTKKTEILRRLRNNFTKPESTVSNDTGRSRRDSTISVPNKSGQKKQISRTVKAKLSKNSQTQ